MQVADKVNSSSWGKVTKQINTQILALHFELAEHCSIYILSCVRYRLACDWKWSVEKVELQ